MNKIFLNPTGGGPISPSISNLWNYTSGYSVIKASEITGSNPYINKTAEHPYHTVNESGKRILNVVYVIGPLTAQSISGSFSGQLQARSSASGENFTTYLAMNVLTSSGTIRKTFNSGSHSTIYSYTVGQNRSINGSISSSQSINSGEYLSIELGATSLNTKSGVQKYWQRLCNNSTGDLPVDLTETAVKNAWISFKNNISLV